jgi:DNA-binding MarR family transcriptional regulator
MPTIADAAQASRTAPMLRRTSSLGYQINHLARLLEAALRMRIAPHGVAPGQFAQLLALYEQDGVSQSELCRVVQIDQSTMALTLRRMERDGLVSRQPSQQDRRQMEIWLTDRARDLEATLVASAHETNALATAGVSEADLATTKRVIARMVDNMAAHAQGTNQ